MSDETAVPEEVLKEMSDDSGFFWLVGIVGVIIFVFFQAFSKKPEEIANRNNRRDEQQNDPQQAGLSGLGLSTFEGVKLFLTKGIGGMCFPMIEDDDEDEQEHEHNE